MTATIHTHARWVKSETLIQQLADMGVQIHADDPMEGLTFPPIGFGERQVGNLTREEATIYRAFNDLRREVEVIDRNIQGQAMKLLGDRISTSDPNEGNLLHMEPQALQPSMTDEELKSYYAKRQTTGFLYAYLYWTMGDRLGLHQELLAIRAKGVIVSQGKRVVGQ